MKELEEKIINAVAKNTSSGILSISQSVLKAIEPTVKDIAIEFAEWVDNMGYTQVENSFFKSFSDEKGKKSKELFDQFIKEKYATP